MIYVERREAEEKQKEMLKFNRSFDGDVLYVVMVMIGQGRCVVIQDVQPPSPHRRNLPTICFTFIFNRSATVVDRKT